MEEIESESKNEFERERCNNLVFIIPRERMGCGVVNKFKIINTQLSHLIQNFDPLSNHWYFCGFLTFHFY